MGSGSKVNTKVKVCESLLSRLTRGHCRGRVPAILSTQPGGNFCTPLSEGKFYLTAGAAWLIREVLTLALSCPALLCSSVASG